MSQGKTSAVKEVTYNSRDYYLGLDYLTRNHPDNSHLRSCYEGISFRNLAQCIMFDRGGKVLKLDRYLKRPKRFVLISTSGEITGVMVTASLPEFYQEIEYEDYAVIGTETSSDYDKFLSHLSFDGRAEIVTFSAKQAQLVRSRFSVKKTHYWSVFASRGNVFPGNAANIRLMDGDDFEVVKQLSKKLPEESSPFRSLQFQLEGLPYKNYVLSLDDMASVFVGTCPYSTGVCQLNYLTGSPTNGELLLAAIGVIVESAQASGCELIWRLRKKDVSTNKILIKRSGLVELVKESHLHLS
jgi:hypothetical protein